MNYKGQQPVRIKVEGISGKIKANDGVIMNSVASFSANKWLKFEIAVDTPAGKYDLHVNGKKVVSGAAFAETLTNTDKPYESKFNELNTPTVERIMFRTGQYRQEDFSRYGFAANAYRKHDPDLPAADEAVENAVYDIDNLKTVSAKN
jgi:hypothetical protein